MVPAILTRVLYGMSKPDDPTLRIRPAILKGYVRRRVRHADYPGITAMEGGTVRGTLVEGITDAGLKRLDRFEGSEYTFSPVNVTVVGNDNLSEDQKEIKAMTYVYTAGEHRLEEAAWDFKQFVQERLSFWANNSKEYSGESCTELMAARRAEEQLVELTAGVAA